MTLPSSEKGDVIRTHCSRAMVSLHGDDSLQRAGLREVGGEVPNICAAIDHGISGRQPAPAPLHFLDLMAAADKKHMGKRVAAPGDKTHTGLDAPKVTAATQSASKLGIFLPKLPPDRTPR